MSLVTKTAFSGSAVPSAGPVDLSLPHAPSTTGSRQLSEIKYRRVLAVRCTGRRSYRSSIQCTPMQRLCSILCLVAAGCTSASSASAPAPSRGAFRAAILGDMPYQAPGDPQGDSIMAAYHAVLDTIGKENVAFVVHIGDITGVTCSDSLYAVRQRE